MSKKRNTLTNVVLLRVFAILIVVLGHSIIFYSTSWNIFEAKIDSPFLNGLKKYINVFQMPLFMFISGYVYNYNRVERNKYSDIRLFIKNKFMRLIIPFYTVAIFYVIPIRLFVDYHPYQGESLRSLIVNHALLGKDIGNLWYLQALFGIFVLFYVLERIFRRMPFWLNLSIFIVISVFSIYVPNVFNLYFTLQYLVYFYLGYIIREMKLEGRVSNKSIIILFILHFIGLFFEYITKYLTENILIVGLSMGFNVLGSLFSCLFYYFFFTKINMLYERIYDSNITRYIDNKSFGIYLFHSPLLYIILYYLSDNLINPYFMVAILFTVMLIGSIIITTLIEKSENLRFIIGKPKIDKMSNSYKIK